MRLINVFRHPWAISPEALDNMAVLLSHHLQGPKLEIPVGFSAQGREYEVRNGAAIINIKGVLSKDPGIIERILFDAVSIDDISDQFRVAAADPNVDKIIPRVSSPGGTVDGAQEFSHLVRDTAKVKPVYAFIEGQAASAAYWAISGATKIYMSGDTDMAGSIGVYYAHSERSEALKRDGINITEIYAGKFKAVGTSVKPLSKDDKAVMQAQVDHIYSIFVKEVAENRGVSVEEALEKMADARIFLGQQAIEAGLVDGISTLDAIINEDGISSKSSIRIKNMNLDKIKAEFPALFDEIKAIGASSIDVAAIEAKAAEKERERIKACHEQARAGYDDVVIAAMFDGKSSAGDVALAINAAEKAKLASLAAGMADDTPGAQTQPPAGDGKKDFMAVVEAYMEEHKCKKGDAIKAIAKANPDLHSEFINGGK